MERTWYIYKNGEFAMALRTEAVARAIARNWGKSFPENVYEVRRRDAA